MKRIFFNRMIRFSLYRVLILGGILFMPACQSKKNTGDIGNSGANPDMIRESGKEVVVTRQQYLSSGMTLTPLDTAAFYVTVHANGYIRVIPQRQAAVSAFRGGYIQSVKVLPGTAVKKGAVLVTLTNPDFVILQQNYLETTAQLKYLKKEYERQKKLSAENIASQKNLQKVESDYNMALAKYKGLQEQFKLLGISWREVKNNHFTYTVSVRSPIAGVVETVETVIGAYVSPEDVIVKIIDPNAFHVELNVYEEDAMKIKKGQKILFHGPGDNGHRYEATLYLATRNIDDQTRTVKVYGKPVSINIPFLQGMYVEADILTGKASCAYLPEKAVVQEGKKYYVLVKTGERKGDILLRKTVVVIGRKEEGRVEILNPEAIGNREVLVEGAFFLL